MSQSILIVIPTLNEAASIAPVLDRLTCDADAFPDAVIAVVDGGSTDGTCGIVERYAQQNRKVRLLDNPDRIQSAAVNLGVRVFGADSDILIRCDAHAIYPENYVARLVEALGRTGADSIVVAMDSTGRSCFQNAVAWISDTKIGSGGSAHRGGRKSGFVDHGHHAAMRVSKFREAGGYDVSFTHNEDAELDCRIRALGGTIFLDADIRLGYRPRGGIASLGRQYFNYGRGRSRTVRRHPSSMRWRQLAVPIHLAISMAAITVWPISAVPLVWPAIYLFALSASSVLIAFRQGSLCGLLSGLAAFTMHSAWAMGFFCGLVFIREQPWRPDKNLGDCSLDAAPAR